MSRSGTSDVYRRGIKSLIGKNVVQNETLTGSSGYRCHIPVWSDPAATFPTMEVLGEVIQNVETPSLSPSVR